MSRPIVVRADWDEEARVWVATSSDLPALVTESESLEALRAKVPAMVGELLELDGVRAESVPIDYVAYAREEVIV